VGSGDSGRRCRADHRHAPADGRGTPTQHRRPRLEKAGVETDGRGYIVVDDQLRTNVEHIWAMGDCNGRGAFTHTSYNDFEIVAPTCSTTIRGG
jgi:pyruvate/2-oxoglutarate dehydrogenase complex dihydrolipoamide dehydrogenase (E3) component